MAKAEFDKLELFVDGVPVGQVSVEPVTPDPGAKRGQITLDLTFKPDWVGLWALQAWLAGRG